MNEYLKYIDEILPEAIQIRRHFHQNPELSFKEKHTSEFIFMYLQFLGLEPFYIEGTYSVLCDINVGNYPNYLFRADIDALPVEEKTGLSFASENKGIMHACGHDVHAAILLATANVIVQHQHELKHNVTLFFQSGEEVNPGGAKSLIQSDYFIEKNFDAAFALHLSPEIETGKIGIREGTFMAASDEIRIKIKGRGGHAALPDNIINPINIASKLYLEIYKLNEELHDYPFTISFGRMIADGSTNVVPDEAIMHGTIRTYDVGDRKRLLDRIYEITILASVVTGAKATLEVSQGYPPVINNQDICQIVRQKAEKVLAKGAVLDIPQRFTSDDFGYITKEVPSCYFRLGCGTDTKPHTSYYNPDEDSVVVGVRVLCGILFEDNMD